MKKIALIFLVVPVFCFAQSKKTLRHFWDIPWGISIGQAEAVFEERGLEFARQGETLMARAAYEGEEAFILLLFNRVDRFYCGNVVYSSSAETVMSKYDKYRKVLFRRYGAPSSAVEYFTAPYEAGDGKEIEAIRSESAFYFTEWRFNDACLASVSILKSLEVCLSFRNPAYANSGPERN